MSRRKRVWNSGPHQSDLDSDRLEADLRDRIRNCTDIQQVREAVAGDGGFLDKVQDSLPIDKSEITLRETFDRVIVIVTFSRKGIQVGTLQIDHPRHGCRNIDDPWRDP